MAFLNATNQKGDSMKTLGDAVRVIVQQAIKQDGVAETPLQDVALFIMGKSRQDVTMGELEEKAAEVKKKLTSSYVLNTSARMPELQAINKRTRVNFYVDDDRGIDCVRVTLRDGAIQKKQRQARLSFRDGVKAMAEFNPDVMADEIVCIQTAKYIVGQYRAHAAAILGDSNED